MWSKPQETADLVTFTEEILHGKLHFLWSVDCKLRAEWSRDITDVVTLGLGVKKTQA